MRPEPWMPPVALSPAEQRVVARIRRAKLFVFLRRIRHDLFDTPFQAELASVYADVPKGQPPIAPAQLALAILLQAYTGASDDEALECLLMDRRWQLVLDCLEAEQAPFGKATLVRFRRALIEAGLDRRLLERTITLAEQDGGMNPRSLRVALDSSPLWGAGRVEDTYNLVGHALRLALRELAGQQGRELAVVADEAGAGVVAGPSLKAALEVDWTEASERTRALVAVEAALQAVAQYVAAAPPETPLAGLAIAEQVWTQDVTVEHGQPALRTGVARDRRISVSDGAMRHGRKSRTVRIDGFKRHAVRDLDRNLVRAVAVTGANRPDADATEAIAHDLAAQAVSLAELHIDRAYLSSPLVRDRPEDLAIYCKAWPVTNGDRFPKTAFTLAWEAETITCPAGVTMPFAVGETVHFPEAHCTPCALRDRCTSSTTGRSVAIHPDERLLGELRERQQTPAGRAKLRERVAIEHTLAHLGRWQGRRARYRGERKNVFDARRAAVIYNLHSLMHRQDAA